MVSHTTRTSSRDALLAFDSSAYSSRDRLPFLVFEIAALLTSRSRRPNSLWMRSAAAVIEA
jgi:hypothetical protein